MAEKATEKKPAVVETVYGLDELARAAEKFGTRDYVVKAAFALAGKAKATKAEAERIINEYRNRKVAR